MVSNTTSDVNQSDFASLAPSSTNLIVPFRANNTGNFIGWYDVKGKRTNATPVVSGVYDLHGESYIMNGELNTNDNALNNRFAIYSTPGNAVVYMDYVRANMPCSITTEKGGLMAISVDEMTKTKRMFYAQDGQRELDGAAFTTMSTPWVNIDNTLGIVTLGCNKQMAFGERANNNSVLTAKLYALYNDSVRHYEQNDRVDKRTVVYYSNTTADATKRLYDDSRQVATPEGWSGVIVADPDGTQFFLLCNFVGTRDCVVRNVNTSLGSPVFCNETTITKEGASAAFTVDENHAIGHSLRFFIKGNGLKAFLASDNPLCIHVRNGKKGKNSFILNVVDNGKVISKRIRIKQSATISIGNGVILCDTK